MEYVYRLSMTSTVNHNIYEIGECDNPRSFPDQWCDRRICEGFWGRSDLAENVCKALTILASTEKTTVTVSDGKFGDNWLQSLPTDILLLAAVSEMATGELREEISYRLSVWREQWEEMTK